MNTRMTLRVPAFAVALLAWLALMIVTYLLIGFAEASLDFTEWVKDARIYFALAGSLSAAVAVAIGLSIGLSRYD